MPPAVRARALADNAVLNSYVSTPTVWSRRSTAVEMARALDDPTTPRPRTPTACGYLRGFESRAAEPYFSEAISLARQTGDDWRLGQILCGRQAYGAAMNGEPQPCGRLRRGGHRHRRSRRRLVVGPSGGWSLGMATMMRAELREAADQFAVTRARPRPIKM